MFFLKGIVLRESLVHLVELDEVVVPVVEEELAEELFADEQIEVFERTDEQLECAELFFVQQEA